MIANCQKIDLEGTLVCCFEYGVVLQSTLVRSLNIELFCGFALSSVQCKCQLFQGVKKKHRWGTQMLIDVLPKWVKFSIEKKKILNMGPIFIKKS